MGKHGELMVMNGEDSGLLYAGVDIWISTILDMVGYVINSLGYYAGGNWSCCYCLLSDNHEPLITRVQCDPCAEYDDCDSHG